MFTFLLQQHHNILKRTEAIRRKFSPIFIISLSLFFPAQERMVQITRQKVGGLGLSIKGGAEHKLPILISRIYKDQAADATGQLFVGDAIIKVSAPVTVGVLVAVVVVARRYQFLSHHGDLCVWVGCGFFFRFLYFKGYPKKKEGARVT